ncbi:N-acetyltransferase [Actinomadura barringtoniae]|uniref:N-acetyltransferase n=1 Tax=Actinomadura barringtoniae TaxID=1427535 RepID=A0A939PTT8_9ACTN|nr:N-acetyltransferase [Actinomadura barringtoniae]MBO2454651.1 N-acetyltransferase [Actinomadura barringtoniae]
MNGWTTRTETGRDIAAVHAVNAAAFEQPAEAELVDALRTDPAWLPGLSWVAEEPGGRVIGYALLTRCHVDEAEALALAPVAVLPGFQKRGVGDAVVRAALDAARDQGERLAVVLGHPDYYPRFGFERASGLGIKAAFEYPDEALMALVLDGASTAPAGTVRYAAPFGV